MADELKVGMADEAYAKTLERLLESGVEVIAGQSKSVGAGKATHEILNYQMSLSNPRERLVKNIARPINLPAAVARFVWMMAGSDRLADIAFYEPKVTQFTDDGVSVPGSSYGQRILRPRPGLNQLEAIIKRLKEDHSTRRAAISVYHAEDAVRDSKDIPCTFGLCYQIRKEHLFSTTIMRSNNSFILLPYNIFEFSLLAEVVAKEIGCHLGEFSYFAVSMHLYSKDFEEAKKVVAAFSKGEFLKTPDFPEMPSEPLNEIRKLVILEAELRHRSAAITGDNVEEWIQRAGKDLNEYWRQFFYLLLFHVATKNHDAIAASEIRRMIIEPYKNYLADPHESAGIVSSPAELELPLDIYRNNIVLFMNTKLNKSISEKASNWEKKHGNKLSWQHYSRLQEIYSEKLAARKADFEIAEDDFEENVRKLLDSK